MKARLKDKINPGFIAVRKGVLYSVEMSFQINVRAARKKLDMTQEELGQAVGVSGAAVSQWERGESLPETERMPVLARVLQTTADQLLDQSAGRDVLLSLQHVLDEHLDSADVANSTEPPPAREVPVKGYVGAGSGAHYYSSGDGYFDTVRAPENATAQTVALEVKGPSLGALFHRWLVFYDDVREPVTSDLIGHLCVVGLTDGRVLVKQLQRSRNGRYILKSNTDEPPIEDARVLWAARVTHMEPR